MAIEPEVHRPITPALDGLVARRMRGAEWLCREGQPAEGSGLPVQEGKGSGEVAGFVDQVPPDPLAQEAGAGFFVDFAGCEELLEEFKAAAEKAGLSPADSALDLIYLFCNGRLRIVEQR